MWPFKPRVPQMPAIHDRSAWWRHQNFELDSTGWLVDGVQTTEPLRFTRDERLAFMRAVVEFARPEMTS